MKVGRQEVLKVIKREISIVLAISISVDISLAMHGNNINMPVSRKPYCTTTLLLHLNK